MDAVESNLKLLTDRKAEVDRRKNKALNEITACDEELSWLTKAIAFLEINVNRITATPGKPQPLPTWRELVHTALQRHSRFVSIATLVKDLKKEELPNTVGTGTSTVDSVRTALRALAAETPAKAVLYKHRGSRKNAFWGRVDYYDAANKRPFPDRLPENLEAPEPPEGGSNDTSARMDEGGSG